MAANDFIAEDACFAKQERSLQWDWLVVAGALALGCALLATALALPRAWAQQPLVLADSAQSVVACGWIILASLFVPIWAKNWTRAVPVILAGGVLVPLGGLIQGSDFETSSKLSAAVLIVTGAISTFWAMASGATSLKRWLWLVSVIGALGWPTWRYLQLN